MPGFDNGLYLRTRSEHICERIGSSGGKLFDDCRASRVLPGFMPTARSGCWSSSGTRSKLSYDIPVLENVAMYPVEENCTSCLRKRNRIRDSDCRGAENQTGRMRYIWNRTTPAKRYIPKKTDDEAL